MRRLTSRLKLRLLFLMSILLTLAIVFTLNQHAFSQDQWRFAKDIAPPGLVDQIVQENFQSSSPVEAGNMKVWKIQQPQQREPLYLIDTRVTHDSKQARANPLCGQQDCLFLGYVPKRDRYQRILNLYLNPHLPPKMALWRSLSELNNGLPCLVAQQLVQEKIQAFKLCFNGQVYEITETQRLPKRYE